VRLHRFVTGISGKLGVVPLPAARGEGGERRRREPGEGQTYARTATREGSIRATHADSRKDRARDAALNAEGYHVLRFWNSDILTNEEGVLTVILAKLQGIAR
jgi:hypothetical protein